jgi:nitric oxide reductase subunit B
METLVWLRVPGDVVFSFGGIFLALYALKLLGRATPAPALAAGEEPSAAE